MPWIPQTLVSIPSGTRSQLGTFSASNQTITLEFPDYGTSDVRLYGVVMARRSLDLAPGSFLSWRSPFRIWNNPELITVQGSANNDQIWFYVPEKFGSDLSVRLYLFA